MLRSIYKRPLWKVIVLLVFLFLGCNQKNTTQTSEIPQKTDPLDPGSTNVPKPPFIVSILGDKGAPAILTGSGPLYLAPPSLGDPHINDWSISSVKEGPIEDTNFSAHLAQEDAPQFAENEKTNQYGLYFGDFQTKTKVSICGTTECKSQLVNLELIVVRSTQKQFADLFHQAKDLPKESDSNEWNLYFFQHTLDNFASDQAASLMLVGANKEQLPELEWNGVFNNNEKVVLQKDKKNPLQLRWTKLGNREFLVGTYALEESFVHIIGVKKLLKTEN